MVLGVKKRERCRSLAGELGRHRSRTQEAEYAPEEAAEEAAEGHSSRSTVKVAWDASSRNDEAACYDVGTAVAVHIPAAVVAEGEETGHTRDVMLV